MDESVSPSDELSSLWNALDAEFAPAAAESPTAPPPALPTSTEEKAEKADGAKAAPVADVPPTPDVADTAEKPAEKPAAERAEDDRLRKLENDLALAKKAQAAADRKLRAYDEARALEYQRIQDLKVRGQLTEEAVDLGPRLTDAWIAQQEAEAQQAEALAEQHRLNLDYERARVNREAEIEFKTQALPIVTELVALGLAPSDVDHETLFRDALNTPDRRADIDLTWAITDPAAQARLTQRIYQGARADVSAKLQEIAKAKAATVAQKGAARGFDRTSSAGPSTGGPDPIPDMPVDELWSRLEWKS